MSAAETGATPPPDAQEMRDTTPRKDTTAAKKTAVTDVTRRALGAEADGPRKKLAEGEKPENLTPAERALSLYESIRTGETATGEPYEWQLFSGNTLTLGPQKEHTVQLESGKKKTLPAFANGEVAVAGFTTRDNEGNYGCFLRDTASGSLIFLDTEGNRVDVAVQPQVKDNSELESDAEAFRRTRTHQAEIGNIILELPVAIDEVADAQLLSEEATIKASLSPEKAALFDEYVKTRPQRDPDETYTLPDDIDSTLQQVEASLPEKKAEAAPDHEKGVLDELVDRQLQQVAQEIHEIQARQAKQNEAGEPLSEADNGRLLKLSVEQSNLTLAKNAPGEFGIILQHGILQQISEQRTGSTIAIDASLSEAKAQAELAGLNFGKFLEDKGLEAQQIDQVMEAFKDPSRLPELFADDGLMGKVGPAMMEGFFGKEANKLDVLTMFDNLTDANNDLLASFPPGLLDRIKGYAKDKPLKKMSIVALILAALPAAAAALAVGAGFTLASGMSGRR